MLTALAPRSLARPVLASDPPLALHKLHLCHGMQEHFGVHTLAISDPHAMVRGDRASVPLKSVCMCGSTAV